MRANPLEPAEVEALPALLAARPLKMAIGKYRSMIEETRISQGHVRKTAQEVSCMRWLEAHERELRTALWGTLRPPREGRGQLDHGDVRLP